MLTAGLMRLQTAMSDIKNELLLCLLKKKKTTQKPENDLNHIFLSIAIQNKTNTKKVFPGYKTKK